MRLRERGVDPVVTREPGGTPAGDRLRAVLLEASHALDPMTELFIVCAARAEHVATVIRPALAAGRTVLCDRFADATVAYQGAGRGLDTDVVRACSGYAAGGLQPDLTLLVDVPPGLSRSRVQARAASSGEPADRLESEGDAFHARVRAGYLAIAAAEPSRVRVLDGTLRESDLLDAAWKYVESALAPAVSP